MSVRVLESVSPEGGAAAPSPLLRRAGGAGRGRLSAPVVYMSAPRGPAVSIWQVMWSLLSLLVDADCIVWGGRVSCLTVRTRCITLLAHWTIPCMMRCRGWRAGAAAAPDAQPVPQATPTCTDPGTASSSHSWRMASYQPARHLREAQVDISATSLLFVDTQNYNCHRDGALYREDGAQVFLKLYPCRQRSDGAPMHASGCGAPVGPPLQPPYLLASCRRI